MAEIRWQSGWGQTAPINPDTIAEFQRHRLVEITDDATTYVGVVCSLEIRFEGTPSKLVIHRIQGQILSIHSAGQPVQWCSKENLTFEGTLAVGLLLGFEAPKRAHA